MNGAVFFSGQYGSTAEYAMWIGEATGLPVFDVKDANVDPSKFDFLILGSSVIYYKLSIRKWVKANWASMENKPIILFTVSGAPAGQKLDGWIAESLPESLIASMDHVALGRQARSQGPQLVGLADSKHWCLEVERSQDQKGKAARF